ncbi:hypothetical protein E2562_005280 [Oryza meyeriana var. granulata]|uniref:Uncharacterized protein n=1 Tax=Oryza meyeriana var. granulata TaxID=110450 RepID=A0A6G1EEY8_9ORYZ|nr:hypothetical protein E2562_005280 [Oryza meyeriana var. granulata]
MGLTSTLVMGDFLQRRLAPMQQCSHLALLYTSNRDDTRMHIGEDHNLGQEELTAMLKVVIGVNDVATRILP